MQGQQRHSFVPHGNCSYDVVSRQDALRCLTGSRVIRLVVAGDSMWRQVFMRFVHLLRNPAFPAGLLVSSSLPVHLL